ncbi:hypothetical protein Bca4012_031822 [Brassica carinata]|uniref:(rape) hypothetical protein n=1 Tax=Brassica napus TaxID=3708 RepID=A0A816JZ37_BRANA|nr:unnamed protein product [Brassica napus]
MFCCTFFWKWITPKMMGLATKTYVYHWSIEGLYLYLLHTVIFSISCICKKISDETTVEIKLPKYFLSCSLVHLSEILRPLGAMQMQSQSLGDKY